MTDYQMEVFEGIARERDRLSDLVDRQALHITHLVMEKRGHDWFAEVLVLREQLDIALKMRDAAREASARDLEARRESGVKVSPELLEALARWSSDEHWLSKNFHREKSVRHSAYENIEKAKATVLSEFRKLRTT